MRVRSHVTSKIIVKSRLLTINNCSLSIPHPHNQTITVGLGISPSLLKSACPLNEELFWKKQLHHQERPRATRKMWLPPVGTYTPPWESSFCAGMPIIIWAAETV